jgi:molybdopterin synthase catalytic subunit
MELTVRLFAGLRDRAGADSVTVSLPDGATAADLVAAMDLPSRSCIVAVNREYAAPEHVLSDADEVALIPPVSGGAAIVRITPDPLDAAAIRSRVTDPRAGAVVVFEGVTREVSHLDYDAYAEMAEPVMAAICGEEAARHGLCAVAVEHRVGRVALGEPSVVVAVSAPHRVEAFAGAAAIMDRLKSEAPIWKREEGEWVRGALPPQPGPPASSR